MVITSTDAENGAQTQQIALPPIVQLRADAVRLRALVVQVLHAHITEMTGPFTSMRQVPGFAEQMVDQFLEVLDNRLTPAEIQTQMEFWVSRGLGPEGAYAVMDSLYGIGAKYEDTALVLALNEYRRKFAVGYEIARRTETLGEHERMQRSLYRALEKQIVSERELREMLVRRQAQLEAAADLARVTGALRDVNDLLATACRHLRERLALSFVAVFILDEFRQRAVLRAGAGEVGQHLMAQGLQVSMGESSPLSHALHENRLIFLKDGTDEQNTYGRRLLPVTAMAAIVPLTTHGSIFGFWVGYSNDADALMPQDAPVLHLIADNLAYAIENAELFAKAQTSLEELQRTQRTILREAWTNQEVTKELVYSQTQDNFGSNRNGEKLAVAASANGDAPQNKLSVPIMLRGEVIGTVDLMDVTQERTWSQDEKLLASSVVEQMGLAVENARLFNQSQQRAQELNAINEITNVISEQLELERLLDEVHQQVQHVMSADAFFVGLYDGVTDMMSYPFVFDDGKRHAGPGDRLSPRGWLRKVVDSGKGLLINRTPQEMVEAAARLNVQTAMGDTSRASASLLYAPLRRADRVVGVISAQSYTPNAYQDRDLELLEGIGIHVAVALQNARLFQATQQREQETAIINEMARQLSGELDQDRLFDKVYPYLKRLLPTDAFVVWFYDEATNTSTRPVLYDLEVKYPAQLKPVPLTARLEQILKTNAPLAVNLTRQEWEQERANSYGVFGSNEASASLLYVPLRVANKIRGFLSVQSYQFNAYDEPQTALLTSVANYVASALENAQLFAETTEALSSTQILYLSAQRFASATTLPDLYHAALEGIAGTPSVDTASLVLATPAPTFPPQATTMAAGWDRERGAYSEGPNIGIPVPWQDLPVLHTLTPNARESLLFTSLDDERIDAQSRAFLQAQNMKSFALLPIATTDSWYGFMVINAAGENPLRAEALQLPQGVANQLALALENRRLFEETEAALQETQTLYNIGARLNQVTSLEELVRIAAQPAFDEGAGSAQLLLMDYEDGDQPIAANVVVSLVTPGDPAPLSPYTHFPIEQFGLGQAMLANPRELVMIDNVTTSPLLDEQTRQVLLASHDQAVVMLPLTVEKRVLGAIAIGWDQPRVFDARERRIYQALSSELALVLNNRLLFEQTQAALQETRTLYEISASLNAANNLQEALEAAAVKALESGAHLAALFAMNVDANDIPRSMTLQATTGPAAARAIQPGTILQLADSPFANAWTQNPSEPVFVEDIETDERLTEKERIDFNRSRVKSAAILPLFMAGRWAGMLGLNWLELHTFTDAERRLYRSVMSQAATVLDNRRLFEQTQEALAETQTLYEISARLNASATIQEALEAAAGPAIVQGAYTAALLKVFTGPGGDPEELEFSAQWPRNAELGVPLGTRFASQYLSGNSSWVANPFEPVLVGNVMTDPSINEFSRASYASSGIQASALLPLKIGDRWIGILNFNWKEPRTFTPRDVRLYRQLMAQASTVLDNRALFEQTQNALALTENLYNASQRLSTADTLQELVAAVTESVNIPAINRAVLLILERDAQGDLDSMYVAANWSNGQGIAPTPVGTRYPRAMFQAIPIVLSPSVVFFDDVPNEVRLDPSSRMVFQRQEILSVALMPLWVANEQRGALLLETQEQHTFTEQESRALISLAPQMAITIENRRLFEATQSALAQTQTALSQVQEAQDRLNLQYQTANILARANSFEQAAPLLLENICHSLNWQMGEYWGIDESTNRLVLTNLWADSAEALQDFAADSYGLTFGPGEGLSGRTWSEGRPIWVPNIMEDAGFLQPEKAKAAGLVSALAFPLQSEARQFGVTVFFSNYAQPMDDTLMATMVGVGSQIGQYMERRRAEESVRQQNTYLTALHDTTLGLMRRLDLDELLQNIITRAGELVGTQHGYVHLIEPSGNELRMRVGIGIYQDFVGTRVKPGQGLAGTVWQQEEPIVVDDYRYWQGRLPMVDRDVLRAVAGVPLKSGTQTVGVLGLASLEEGRKFGAAQIEALDRFAELAAVALDNAQLYNASQSALEHTQRVAEREKVSAEIADKLYAASDIQAVLRTAAEELRRNTKSRRAIVRLNLSEPAAQGHGNLNNGNKE